MQSTSATMNRARGKRRVGRFAVGSLGLGFGFHFVSVDRCSPRSASRVLRERSLAISCARRTRRSPGLTPGLFAALHAVAGRGDHLGRARVRMEFGRARLLTFIAPIRPGLARSIRSHSVRLLWAGRTRGWLVQPTGRGRTSARRTRPRPSTSIDSPGAQAAMSCVSARSRRRRIASAGRPRTAGMASSNPR